MTKRGFVITEVGTIDWADSLPPSSPVPQLCVSPSAPPGRDRATGNRPTLTRMRAVLYVKGSMTSVDFTGCDREERTANLDEQPGFWLEYTTSPSRKSAATETARGTPP